MLPHGPRSILGAHFQESFWVESNEGELLHAPSPCFTEVLFARINEFHWFKLGLGKEVFQLSQK